MHAMLATILVLLGAAVVIVVVCRLVRLPPVLGYLLVGLLVGPHALGWVEDTPATRHLAEFGIVFLMFSLGLEFSLAQLKAMRRAVFGLGFAQVAITTVAGLIALTVVGFSWQAGLVLGGALAMSSTAIVTKMLTERGELTTPHGRDIIAILLFQDLAVVAYLIVIPALGQSGGDLTDRARSTQAAKGAVALMLILGLGQKPMRSWFNLVARQRSSELFVLNVLLVTLGLAMLTELAGLSLALGAFLAGMLISETEFRIEVEEDIKPFRDVLLGLFFVTVGMALDVRVVFEHWAFVLLLLVVPVLFKLMLIVALARVFGAPLASALRTGFYLAQAGELALVMLTLASLHAILEPALTQVVLAAMVHLDARVADRHPVRGADRAQADGERLAGAGGATDQHRVHCDGASGARADLRLRTQRAEPRPPARARGHPVRCAGQRSAARARGRGRRLVGRVRRRFAARGADRGGRRQGEGGRDHVRRYADRGPHPAPRASAASRPSGHRAHAWTTAISTR